jgi:hypothetical protein
MLQFKEIVRIIERLFNQPEPSLGECEGAQNHFIKGRGCPFVGGDADATDQRREAARLLTLAAFGVWSECLYRFRCVPLEKVSK